VHIFRECESTRALQHVRGVHSFITRARARACVHHAHSPPTQETRMLAHIWMSVPCCRGHCTCARISTSAQSLFFLASQSSMRKRTHTSEHKGCGWYVSLDYVCTLSDDGHTHARSHCPSLRLPSAAADAVRTCTTAISILHIPSQGHEADAHTDSSGAGSTSRARKDSRERRRRCKVTESWRSGG
jgi:hypothetical protein